MYVFKCLFCLTFQNFNTYLRRLFLSKREEAEEDNLEYSFECRALLDDGIDFGELSLKNRVNILNQLCEFRLEAEDVCDKVRVISIYLVTLNLCHLFELLGQES